MAKNKVKNFLIVCILILLLILIVFSMMQVIIIKKDNDKDDNQVDVAEPKEIVNINDSHCVNGFCVRDYNISRLENGKFELKFLLENTNEFDLEKGCFKLYFSEDDNYIFCHDFILASGYIENIFEFDDDSYLKYDDYKLEQLVGDELSLNYDSYSKNLIIER